MTTHVTVTGFPELREAMRALEAGARDAAKDAVDDGAGVIAQRWREKVPVRTGAYRDRINVLTRRTKVGATARVGVSKGPAYPYILEVGSSKMAARPSALPAYDEAKDDAIEAAHRRLAEAVDR